MEYTSFYWQVIRALAEKYDADMDTPYKDLPKKFKEVLLIWHRGRKAVLRVYQS